MKKARSPQKEFDELIHKYPALIDPTVEAMKEYIIRRDELLADYGDLPAPHVAAMVSALLQGCFEKHTKNIKICS